MLAKITLKIAMVFLVAFTACTPPQEQSDTYDKKINEAFDNFNQTYLSYIKSLKSKDFEDIEIKKNNTLKLIQLNRKYLNELKEIDEDQNYLGTIKNYFNVLENSIINTDENYLTILKKDSLLTQTDSSLLLQLTKNRLIACDKAYIEFQNAQKKFRNTFKLNETNR